MPRHLAVGHRVRGFLQLEDLEVDTLALVRQDKEWVERAVGPARLLRVALPWQGVALEAGLNAEVGNGCSAGPALNRDVGSLGLDARGGHHNARDLHHLGDVAAHQRADGDADLVAAEGHVNVLQIVFLVTRAGNLGQKF